MFSGGITHYTSKNYPRARRVAERWQVAFPKLCFCPVQHPSAPGWTVAVMVGRDIVGYCPHILPAHKLPGEPGYREAVGWLIEYKIDLPDLKVRREARIVLPGHYDHKMIIKTAKRILCVPHRGITAPTVTGSGWEHITSIGGTVLATRIPKGATISVG